MNCTKCGAQVQEGSKFCPGCGSPVSSRYCANCGSQVSPDVKFCPNCGKSIAGGVNAGTAQPPPPSAGKTGSNLKDTAPDETVLMDTGLFPITYVKNMMSSTNGKLSLTSRYLVFKAGKLQGVGGVTPVPGLFIPNPMDAGKSKTHFAIPLSEITSVETGWSHITVQAGANKYKFGAMRKTKEWQEAINKAKAQSG